MSTDALAGRHDALLVDLDGTLVLAGRPIEHAASTLQQVRSIGTRILVVTNNASRAPAAVAERLTGLGIPTSAEDVVSSPLAAGQLLAATHRPGDRVLVVGTDALADAVSDAGLTPVRSAHEHPVAVVQGHSPNTGWRDLAEACVAIRAGADWVATNTDGTLPTDRGQLPGNGAMVQALVTATGRQPRVAGKPARPLLDVAARRAGAHRPLVVGDRLDTDIAAAVAAGMPSLMVLTGVSTAADVLAAPADRRPSLVAVDLRGLLDPAAVITLPGHEIPGEDADPVEGNGWRVTDVDGHLELAADGSACGSPLAALGALAPVAWRAGISEVRAADQQAARALESLGLR